MNSGFMIVRINDLLVDGSCTKLISLRFNTLASFMTYNIREWFNLAQEPIIISLVRCPWAKSAELVIRLFLGLGDRVADHTSRKTTQ